MSSVGIKADVSVGPKGFRGNGMILPEIGYGGMTRAQVAARRAIGTSGADRGAETLGRMRSQRLREERGRQ
jgi:hypothetical protein